MSRIRPGRPETRQPLPLDDLTALRQALASPHPHRAAIAALAAFHGLRNHQLRQLRLTDVSDGRLRLGDRTIPLAPPVRERLAAWLSYRSRRWPGTVKPPPVHQRAHRRARRPGQSPLHQTDRRDALQAIREDRILDEVHATDGDIRHLIALFGLSVAGALRYTGTVGHPGLRDGAPVV